jgi:hypothetical protein
MLKEHWVIRDATLPKTVLHRVINSEPLEDQIADFRQIHFGESSLILKRSAFEDALQLKMERYYPTVYSSHLDFWQSRYGNSRHKTHLHRRRTA